MNATRHTDEMIIAVAISVTSMCYQVVKKYPPLSKIANTTIAMVTHVGKHVLEQEQDKDVDILSSSKSNFSSSPIRTYLNQ